MAWVQQHDASNPASTAAPAYKGRKRMAADAKGECDLGRGEQAVACRKPMAALIVIPLLCTMPDGAARPENHRCAQDAKAGETEHLDNCD